MRELQLQIKWHFSGHGVFIVRLGMVLLELCRWEFSHTVKKTLQQTLLN